LEEYKQLLQACTHQVKELYVAYIYYRPLVMIINGQSFCIVFSEWCKLNDV
jgi:hypothetical protein